MTSALLHRTIYHTPKGRSEVKEKKASPRIFTPGPTISCFGIALITIIDYEFRMKAMSVRELLLGLWKIHILLHAGEEPVVGQWILRELREHGYEVSPGTLYPLLARMEESGWLESEREGPGIRARKQYRLTAHGRELLDQLRPLVRELCHEMH